MHTNHFKYPDIVPQSLMNQESQQQIETILSNTQDFLTNNGMTMTDAEINDVFIH